MEACETCMGSGHGDVRDIECSMCKSETPLKPREPESLAEEILENEAFVAANDPKVPQYARELIAKLWAEAVAREQWKKR